MVWYLSVVRVRDPLQLAPVSTFFQPSSSGVHIGNLWVLSKSLDLFSTQGVFGCVLLRNYCRALWPGCILTLVTGTLIAI